MSFSNSFLFCFEFIFKAFFFSFVCVCTEFSLIQHNQFNKQKSGLVVRFSANTEILSVNVYLNGFSLSQHLSNNSN